ncbi:hypothetical protein [Nocardiopsis halophila]|uniref:hypothetical protein n=1 Tax=Nocardiopsis halophila TaxID=141692 RepID=UPI000373760F|nr:hypothetical protein [Nocardiopsis halophila]
MGTYTVHARKWDDGWELRIVGAGVTWAPDLSQAGPAARAFVGDPAARIEVVPTVGEAADRMILRARRRVDAADEARRGAAGAVAEAVRALGEAGVDERDAARLLGLTRARVRGLAAEAPADGSGGDGAPERSGTARRNARGTGDTGDTDGTGGAHGPRAPEQGGPPHTGWSVTARVVTRDTPPTDEEGADHAEVRRP